MKGIHTTDGAMIVLSVDEAKTVHSCMSVAVLSLDDWEYEIKVGVSKEDVVRVMASLKAIIEDAGQWGVP